jgi:RimJ/RimL family protein N-acetyltransferase
MLRPAFPLVTQRLVLRPFVDDDLDALYEIESNEDVTRYLYRDELVYAMLASEWQARAPAQR